MPKLTTSFAQTFNTNGIKGGMYLTAVDIFFKTKDQLVPIVLEIRTTNEGIPSETNVPNSTVIMAASQVGTSDYAQTATKFVFSGPVVLEEDKEYAIILRTNSDRYNAWVAQIGQVAINKSTSISKQPNPGVLYLANGGTTWTPDTSSDLMFRLYKAQFTTNTVYNLTLKSTPLNPVFVNGHILETVSGSSTVYFNIKNHGLFVNDRVSISVNDPAPSTFNGLTVVQLNGAGGAAVSKEYIVTVADNDSFGITVTGTPPTATGICYVKSMMLTVNLKADLINVTTRYVKPPSTNCDFYIKTTSGRSRGGNQTRYVTATDYVKLDVNTDIDLKDPIMVPSVNNKAAFLPSTEPLLIKATISTSNANVSPIIRQDLMNVVMVDHLLDDETNVPSRRVVAETDKNAGSSISKYVAKPITLDTKATSIRISFAANITTGNMIDVYYKVSDTDTVADSSWVLLAYPITPVLSTTATEFKDYTLEVRGLAEFKTYSIKLVFRGANSCLPPRAKQLRAIALAI